MSSQQEPEKRSKLTDQIEVEVVRQPHEAPSSGKAPASYEANPLLALEELVERLESLEDGQPGGPLGSNAGPMPSISDLERHLEAFQRQSALLKRLLMKLH